MESFLWNLSWELEKILSLSVFENKLDKLLVGMICDDMCGFFFFFPAHCEVMF